MGMWRIRAQGNLREVPSMAGALIPVPAGTAQAWQSRGPIHGSPGTEMISAPYPQAFGPDAQVPAAMAHWGVISSRSTRPVMCPPLYYQTDTPAAPLERSPVQYLDSSHELPVPAIQAPNVLVARGVNQPGGITQAGPGSWLARMGGNRQIAWPLRRASWGAYTGPGA
jgi:hypothetical protein